MYYQCITNVLPMYYQCITNVLPIYYQCIINLLSMYYQFKYNLEPWEVKWALVYNNKKISVNFNKTGYKDSLNSLLYYWQFIQDYKYKVKHPFHLVEPSLLPIFFSFWLALNLGYIVCSSHFVIRDPFIVVFLLIGLVATLLSWLQNVRLEEVLGFHTLEVQAGFRLGIKLFILSEVMLFVAFFWAFFHLSLSPAVATGLCWPVVGLPFFAWNKIPLINTALLLSSGIDITIAHKGILFQKKQQIKNFWKRILFFTSDLNKIFFLTKNNTWQRVWVLNIYINKILLIDNLQTITSKKILGRKLLNDALIRGLIFLWCQYLEYFFSPFSISDGAYGSIFFMATGLHGLHVIVGFSALCYCAFTRFQMNNVGYRYWQHNVGFDGSVWYWHFVDIVWLLLFGAVYWWSGI